MPETDPSSPLPNPHDLIAQAAAIAAHLQRSGVSFLPQPNADSVEALTSRFAALAAVESPSLPAPAPDRPEPAVAHAAPLRRLDPVPPALMADLEAGAGNYPGDPLPIAERESRLEILAVEVASCTRCEILATCRNKTVFGEGNAEPRFVFFGEGPGADEDQSGRPFVGKAGQLLTKMIEACKFRREDAYILNTVKCRPPGNRNPEPDELTNCRTYYEQQLSLLRPEYIVCLGAISGQELLKSKLSVGRLRGQLHRYLGSKVLVTYHPAYLLRNPAAKRAAWEDLQLMLRDAGMLQ